MNKDDVLAYLQPFTLSGQVAGKLESMALPYALRCLSKGYLVPPTGRTVGCAPFSLEV